jgi:type I restriction enzyme S subunit
MKTVALGEVCDFIRGVAFDGNEAIDLSKEGYVPILRAGNIGDELYIRDDLVWVPQKRVSEEQYFQVGDIAICMASGSPAVLGKTAQLKENFMGSVGAFCGIIRPTKADPNYIAYWLKSPTFMAWRDSQANGVNIQNLRPNEVREIEIPLPPLTEQKRIASLLARADRLRSLRRTAHDLGESLLQSVFLEMFGDLEINSGNWDRTTIEEIATKVTDGEHVTPERTTSGVKLLSARNIQNGYIDVENELVDYISQEEYERIKVRLDPELGDVLMSCSGTVGRVTTVDITEPFSLVRSVALIKPIRSLVHPKYLEHYLRSNYGQRLIFLNANISGQPNIFQRQIRELPVSLPPLNLQEEFAGMVARVESLRGRMGESTRQVEGLFEALLSESFGG